LKSSQNNKYSNIYIAKKDGKNIQQVTFQKNLILEAIFSKDSESVFYLMAKEYDNHSPIARKDTHGIDIYFLDLKSLKSKKLTNFNAYSLGSLTLIENGKWLAFRIMDENTGLYKLNLTNFQDTISTNPV